MAGPEISVVTVTHDRLAVMRRKVDSMLRQTLRPERFEWIIRVNGCTDGTLEVLQALDLPFRMRLDVTSSQESPAMARNACARLAQGRFLYLSDDDCLLEPHTLARHLRAQEHREAVFVGGIVFDDGASTILQQPGRARYWHLNGANTSLPQNAFQAVGGFDEDLMGYGGEDVLLGYRLRRHGLAFLALPQALVRHLGPDPLRSLNEAKGRSAGANAVRIAARVPALALRLGVHPALLSLKRLMLNDLTARIFAQARYRYERAYLEGALEERRHDRQPHDSRV
ncbi:MAG TPA: glycosyltransferase [Trueperaceae bacterium]